MDREIHILQRNLFRRIAEFQIRDPQKFLPVLLPADPRLLRMIPAAHLLLVFPGERQLLHMLRVQRLRDLHPRITQCRQIKRLPDSVLQKLFSRKQLLRRQIRHDRAFIHKDDPIHSAPEHILQPVLDDQHRRPRAFMHHIDQFNGRPSGSRIQIRQRLVKQQHLDRLHHHAGQADPLLLAAGQLIRRILQMMVDIHQPGHPVDQLLHLLLRHTVILRRKRNIFSHRQADKLPVRILQHRPYHMA